MSIASLCKPQNYFRALLLCVAALLSVSNTSAINSASADATTAHGVEIKGFKFSQAALIVRPGDNITWTNLDIAPHTATALDKSWTSPELKTGESYTMKVTADTSTDYFCIYHPSMVAALEIAAE